MQPAVEAYAFDELCRVQRALLVVDVVESVRLLLAHEDDVIRRWRRFLEEVRAEVLPRHGGRLVKSLGDGMLVEFDAVLAAINAAMDMHRRLRAYNAARVESAELHLRAGVHQADVVVDELDLYGAGVNLASRLAALAGPDETILSPEARDSIVSGLDFEVEDLGDCFLKHFSDAQRAYRVGPTGSRSVMWSGKTVGGQDTVSIAVIPLVSANASATADTCFFGDVLADDLIAQLSRLPQLHVVSRLSTAAFRDRQADPGVLFRALGCQYAVHGSCAFIGDKVRVRVHLTDCVSHRTLWADAVDGSMAAILGADNGIVGRLTREICHVLVQSEVRRAQTMPLPSLHSYTILLGAIAMMHRLSLRDFQRSQDMLVYLCERHPRATAPRAWLGKWHVMRVAQGWSPDRVVDAQQARAIVSRALDMEPDHALALAIDGLVCAYINKDLDTAGQRYTAALDANPSESLAWLFQSALHSYADQGPLAVECAMRAQRLSPLDPMRYYYDNFTSVALLSAADYAGAIRYGQLSLRGNRTHGPTLRILAIAQVMAGHVDDAKQTIMLMRAVEPDLSVAKFLDRYPGAAAPHAAHYADALRTAGLPD